MLMVRVNKAQAAKIVKSKNIIEGPNFAHGEQIRMSMSKISFLTQLNSGIVCL